MDIHGNAALGPAGRLALVQAIGSGMTLRAAAAALKRRAGHGPSLVASLARGERGRAPVWELVPGPPLHAAPPAQAAIGRRRGADSAGAARDRSGPRPSGGDLPPGPLDDLEGAAPPRSLPATQGRQGDLPPL